MDYIKWLLNKFVTIRVIVVPQILDDFDLRIPIKLPYGWTQVDHTNGLNCVYSMIVYKGPIRSFSQTMTALKIIYSSYNTYEIFDDNNLKLLNQYTENLEVGII